jgi:hypothetical protein
MVFLSFPRTGSIWDIPTSMLSASVEVEDTVVVLILQTPELLLEITAEKVEAEDIIESKECCLRYRVPVQSLSVLLELLGPQ